MPFAVYVPMRANQTDHARVTDLVVALVHFEPSVTLIVLVQDGEIPGGLWDGISIPSTCQIVQLPHPRPNNELNMFGGLCTASLLALNYMYHCGQAFDFVLKLDTDSLVIAQFAEKITSTLSASPRIGMIGVLGDSCNRMTRTFFMDHRLEQIIRAVIPLGTSLVTPTHEETTLLHKLGVITDEQLERFRRICTLLKPIVHKKFSGSHCQGGGYAVSNQVISRLSSAGLLADPNLWLDLKMGEDQMMGVLCSLLDLRIVDHSAPGDVFGVQARGLAYAPAELLDKGYSIVHSIKNDPNYSEEEIRFYFATNRVSPPR